MVTETLSCYHCGSVNLRRDGKAPNGKQKCFCHDCKKSSRKKSSRKKSSHKKSSHKNPTSRAYSAEFQAQVLAACPERCSQRGVCRIFGIAIQTLTDWLEKAATLPPLKTTLANAQKGEPLELDELWSFMRPRRNKRRVWLAQCRKNPPDRGLRCWRPQRGHLCFAVAACPEGVQERHSVHGLLVGVCKGAAPKAATGHRQGRWADLPPH